MTSPTAQRERAIRAATSDTDAALRLARDVDDPWYRCQALAWVARFAPEDDAVARIADESLAAARSTDDAYKHVAAAAWPVRALVEHDLPTRAVAAVADRLPTARAIPHPVNRVDALDLLHQAIFPLGPAARRAAQQSLVDACLAANSWRAGRTLRDLVLTVAADDPAEVQSILARTPESAYRRQTLRHLAAGRHDPPRPFFWTCPR